MAQMIQWSDEEMKRRIKDRFATFGVTRKYGLKQAMLDLCADCWRWGAESEAADRMRMERLRTTRDGSEERRIEL